jgi:hypothetical protein
MDHGSDASNEPRRAAPRNSRAIRHPWFLAYRVVVLVLGFLLELINGVIMH